MNNLIKKFITAIKKWWNGTIVPMEQTGGIIFISPLIERHWTSQFAHKLVEFYLNHWKWIWMFLLSATALYVNYHKPLDIKSQIESHHPIGNKRS